MTDWIDQKAAQIEKKEAETRDSLDSVRQTVDQLETVVRRDIEKWNAKMRQKIDGVTKSMPTGAFKIRKTSFPSAAIDVFLSTDSSSIQVELTKRRTVGDGAFTIKNQFPLKQAVDGGVRLTKQTGEPVSLEAVSRILIETLMESS